MTISKKVVLVTSIKSVDLRKHKVIKITQNYCLVVVCLSQSSSVCLPRLLFFKTFLCVFTLTRMAHRNGCPSGQI